jgi:hypothetical protein
MEGGKYYMVPNDWNVKKTYSFTITGTANGGASYTLSGLKFEVKCLGGLGFTGNYTTEVRYPKIVGKGATSIFIFPTTFEGILETLCPIESYEV